VEVFKCPFDKTVTVLVIDPKDQEYDQANEVFSTGTHGFTLIGGDIRAMVIDGAIMKEDWYTGAHLRIIMAHELGHIHNGTEDEQAADLAGFEILAEHGPMSAIDLYFQEMQARYCV